MKVAVIGAGAWGTALAKLLVEAEHDVVLWSHRAEGLKEIASSRRFESGLPGVELPVAQPLMAPAARLSEGKATRRCTSNAVTCPSPAQVAQAPMGELNENSRGSSSASE